MKGGAMSPNDLHLPDFDRFEMGPRLGLDKIWRILWVLDPPRLKKPDDIVEVVDIYIKHEIRVAEMAIKIFQEEVRTMQELQEKLHL
jgi:hypothetical protein